MSVFSLNFNSEQFERIFPYHILLDKDLTILSTGSSLNKIIAVTNGNSFNDIFTLSENGSRRADLDLLQSLHQQSLSVEINNAPSKISLSAQVEYFEEHGVFILQFSPENEFQPAKPKTEDAVRSKETYLAYMSHEIRTPLNAIIGMSRQLNKTVLTEKQSTYLQTLHTAADNLLIIINDILDLSKLEAGKLLLEKTGFAPKEVISRALMVLQHRAEEKGIQLTSTFFDDSISPVLVGAPHRINQVLLNLIGNAIKFTDNGGVEMACHLVASTDQTHTVAFRISDTGIGMEEAFVERLFDKFSQEYETYSERFGGTGLGMSISKELIELMGGKITVESKKGKGTTITFEIEFEKGSAKDLPVKEDLQENNDVLNGKIILIADDNEMNRLVAKATVENYGASTLEAANGKEVIQLLEKNNQVDLILLDVQMPEMDGLETARYIREKLRNDIPIIALTAHAINGEIDKCIEAGMNQYLSKPFAEEELIHLAATLLIRNESPQQKKSVQDHATVPLYDLSGLEEIARGDKNFIKKVIGIFTDQAPVLVEEMNVAYKENDLLKMGLLAHKLKSSIDILNIHSLKQVIREIEKMGKDENNNDQLPVLLNTVENTIRLVTEVFNN